MTRRRAAAVISLLSVLCERGDKLSSDELKACGRTARALLTFAWQDSRNRWLAVPALRCVCQTFESEPLATASLLRRALESQHLADYGFQELPLLAREAKRLIAVDSDFIADLFRGAFGHVERSKEQTALGDSQILSLRSNRKQDYGGALWQLAEIYPKYLEQRPQQGTEVLLSVLQSYVTEKHTYAAAEVQEHNFQFDGKIATLRSDNSYSWDLGETYRHDEPVRMLSAFHRYVARLADQPNSSGQLDEILDVVARRGSPAVVWKRLLTIGAFSPDTLGVKLRSLLYAVPILACTDTTTELGNLLHVMFGRVSALERDLIERAILSLPDDLSGAHSKRAEYLRDRLAGCLDPALVVTEAMHQLLTDMRLKGEPPANEPFVRSSGLTARAYGEEEYLRGEGVPIDDEPNKRIRSFEKIVKQVADEFRNGAHSGNEMTTSCGALSDLWGALGQPGVHPKQYEHGLDLLAEACSSIAGSANCSPQNVAVGLVREVLLKASLHPTPTYDSKQDEQFDKAPSWGRPSPRLVAAEGLTKLGRHVACATEDTQRAIERLSSDQVSAVRYQVVQNILSIYQTAPELMWRIVESVSQVDTSRSVLHQLVSGALSALASPHSEQVVRLTRDILNRFEKDPDGKDLRAACLTLFAQLYVWRDEPKSKEIVYSIATKAGDAPDDAFSIVGWLRDLLTHGPVELPDPIEDGVRKRALDLLSEVVASASRQAAALVNRNLDRNFESWQPAEQELMRGAGGLLDRVGMEMYFASGAYDSQRADGQNKVPRDARKRFYFETSSILDQLASAGFPSLVHHLLETLETFIEIDPKGVFLKIGAALTAGRSHGYQFESQGAELFVKLIERYLAEHREIFQQDAQCRQILRESLDLFVNWPGARRLVYRLEYIFR
jgi:hypothetical protein